MKAPRVNKFHKKPKEKETSDIENISTNGDSEENNPHVIENVADTKVHLLAQELKFAQSLAGNDPKTRRKVLKNLKKWLHLRSTSSYPFSYDDFLRLWKGLFYCMWMSDKPLIQEALAEDISKLIHCFEGVEFGIQFFGAFLKVMSNEWFGLDQWRMDKFMMLVRRCTRQLFIFLQNNDWDTELLAELEEHLFKSVLNKSCSCGLTMHFIDIYPEEFAKILEGDIDSRKMALIFKPFVESMAKQNDRRLLNHIRDNIFHHLIQQSDLGRIYREKYNVWASMGFPGTIDDIEEVNPDELDEEEKKLIQHELSDDEEKNDDSEMDDDNDTQRKKTKKELDLRAGRVDVVIPEIKFDPMELIKLFEQYLYKPFTNKNSRTAMRGIMMKLNKFANGIFPLGLHKMPRLEDDDIDIDAKAKDLLKYSKTLLKDTNVLKKVNKKKRKKIIYGDMEMPSVSGNKQNSQNEWKEEEINEDFNPNEFTYSAAVANADSDDDLEVPAKKRKQTSNTENGNIKKLKTKDKKKLLKKNKTFTENIDKHIENGSLETEENEKLKVNKKESKKMLNNCEDEWAKPLQDGEVEIFMPSRKKKLEEINKSLSEEADPTTSTAKKTKKETTLVINPFAKKLSKDNIKTPKSALRGKGTKHDDQKTALSSNTLSAEKRVKIVLTKNQSQDTSEYIKQVRNSPQTPYDADKKPTKGLLKPNLMPSPIHPFYKKKIGLNFDDMI